MPLDRTTTIAPTRAFAFDEVSNVLYSVQAGQITRWDAVTGAFLNPITVPSVELSDIAVSPDGRYLVVGERNVINGLTTLYRVDLQTQAITTITSQQYYGGTGVASIVITASGDVLFTTHFAGSGFTPLQSFALSAPSPAPVLVGSQTFSSGGHGPSLATSPDGRLVLIGETSSSTGLTIYDSVTRQFSTTQRYQQGYNYDQTAISSTGLVAAASYNSLIVYNAQLMPVKDFSYRMVQEKITDIEFSPDGRLLYAWNATTDRIEVWDTTAWIQLTSLDPEILVDTSSVTGSSAGRMQLSDDGRFLMLSTLSGVRILDLEARLVLPSVLVGSTGTDTLVGGVNADILIGGGGGDILTGGAGGDLFRYGSVTDSTAAAADLITDFQTGEDRIDFSDLSGVVVPSRITASLSLTRLEGVTIVSGQDWHGGAFQIVVNGDVNAPDVVYGWHSVTMTGSDRSDSLIGGAYDDTMSGGAGDDTLVGGAGADVVDGGQGNDTIHGGDDADDLSGGTGDDVIHGGAGADTISGGGGFDTAVFSVARSTATITYSPGVVHVLTNDGADRLISIEAVRFTDGVYDVINGRLAAQARQTLLGSVGVDRLNGGGSSDTIMGLEGDDLLTGGTGNDLLDGGAGIDAALYSGVRLQYATSQTSVSGNGEGLDTLVSIENLVFVDGTLTFDASSASAQVMRLYSATLNRAPDQGGLEANVANLARLGIQGLADLFVGSDEFQARFGALNNQQFVEQMYRFALGREGDPAGVAHWVGVMNGGASRGQMVVAFSESAEHQGRTAPTLAAGLWVPDLQAQVIARMYDATFDRLPDVGGLATWTANLKAGMSLVDIAAAFAGSAEFQQRYGTVSNEQFVRQMYQFCLDREPDAGGLASWTAALEAGTSRAQMLLNFSESAEHMALTAASWLGGVRFAGYVGAPLIDEGAVKGLDDPFVLPTVSGDEDAFVPLTDPLALSPLIAVDEAGPGLFADAAWLADPIAMPHREQWDAWV